MPRMLTLLLDLGPGEKGMTENNDLLSKRKMTLCFSAIRTTWGSLVWVSRMEPGQEAPESVIPGSHLASFPNGDRDRVTSSDCPFREGSVPEGAGAASWATPLWTLLFEVSLLSKW
jgi:hypothetical protein